MEYEIERQNKPESMADEDYNMVPMNPCQIKQDISIHQKIFETLMLSCLVYCKKYFDRYFMLSILVCMCY